MLIAGCSDNTGQPPSTEPTPCLVTAATDLSCQQDLNGTGGSRPHLHDYWQGQDRVALDPVTTDAGGMLCSSAGRLARIFLADGDTVYQGTAQVEATLTFAQGATDLPGTFSLAVKTAGSNGTADLGPIESGVPVTVDTTNEDNDLPHQVLSAWEFHLVGHPANPTGCFSYGGDVTLEATLVRGLEIPLYPGHPDRWDGTDAKPLLDLQRDVFYFRGDQGGAMCLNGPGGGDCLWDPLVPQDGAIVPQDADQVVVTVTHHDDPLRTRLAYHGADTRELTFPEPSADDGTTRQYLLPVTGNGDGPYARQSQWEFWLFPEGEANAYHGSVAIQAEALREA